MAAAQINLFKPSQACEPAASNEPGHIGWRALHASDWPKAFDFYAEMFGAAFALLGARK